MDVIGVDQHACSPCAKAIGRHGEPLVPDGKTVLTHCNAGALATAGYGTALGVIRAAVSAGKKIDVFADETRPFLQGARLSRPAVLAGILHWRLHLIIFAATFVAFPFLGLALSPLSGAVLTPPLYIGLIFLCTLPSAVHWHHCAMKAC